jgi:predicted Zn-dependent protease
VRRIIVVLAALGLVGCFRTSGLNRYQPDMYSVDQEIGMGKQMSKEVEKDVALLRHHALTQLVQGIGQRLVEHAQDPEFKLYPYTFKVVDSSEVNAFALPGGPVYVNLGLIELCKTEDELAAVIAHEMSHVAARHASEGMTTTQLSQLALLVTFSAIGALPPMAMEGTRLGYVLGMLRYTRGMESEADELGIHLMESAGYDPRGMVWMLKHIAEERREDPVLIERLTSSHPMPDERIEAAEAMVATSTADRTRKTAPAFTRTLALFAKD